MRDKPCAVRVIFISPYTGIPVLALDGDDDVAHAADIRLVVISSKFVKTPSFNPYPWAAVHWDVVMTQRTEGKPATYWVIPNNVDALVRWATHPRKAVPVLVVNDILRDVMVGYDENRTYDIHTVLGVRGRWPNEFDGWEGLDFGSMFDSRRAHFIRNCWGETRRISLLEMSLISGKD
jgi:hypothetical protein